MTTIEELRTDLRRVKGLALVALDRLQAQTIAENRVATPTEHAEIEALFTEGQAIKARLDALPGAP